MLTRKKARITVLILTAAIIATVFVGYANATESEVLPMATNYSFWINPSSYGAVDLATAREKEVTLDYAYFNLTTVTNTSGYDCYINVRNSAGTTRVGSAATVTGKGLYDVYYLSGYGNVGTYYRPSGQTSSYSTKSAYIEGTWRP